MTRAREKVWVVRPGDGATVGEIVTKAREDAARAIADGRVFIGRKRALSESQAVKPGEAIRIGPPEALPPIEILFERDGVVACVKPAGLPTVPDHSGAAHSLVALVARTLGTKLDDLRVTSRLDRDVSGVVLFARTEAAEARLREARAAGRYERRYIAVAAGSATGATSGIWDGPIGRAKDPLLRMVNGTDAKESLTRWRIAGSCASALLLVVEPETGRTHQIRVHSAHAGWPLFGDRDYGGPTRLTLANGAVVAPTRVALHAARVSVDGLIAVAPLPLELRQLWRVCGGADDALDVQ